MEEVILRAQSVHAARIQNAILIKWALNLKHLYFAPRVGNILKLQIWCILLQIAFPK